MQLCVFTKPWKTMPLPRLAAKVRGLGFDGIELPVRPGFQVQPQDVMGGLPAAANVFADHGVRIVSVAGPTDPRTIDACAAAGVKIIRICLGIDPVRGYRACIDQFRFNCEQLTPILERAGVTIGLQNHAGNDIGSAIGLMHAIEPLDPQHIAAVLDVAHCALAGEPEEIALDIAWPRLCMVNLKNGIRRRVEDGDGEARWKITWIGARQGYASWATTIRVLRARGYEGPVCLTAEYSDHEIVEQQIVEDVGYVKDLMGWGDAG
jgi:sugar phosphate isomerase/epimerase